MLLAHLASKMLPWLQIIFQACLYSEQSWKIGLISSLEEEAGMFTVHYERFGFPWLIVSVLKCRKLLNEIEEI